MSWLRSLSIIPIDGNGQFVFPFLFFLHILHMAHELWRFCVSVADVILRRQAPILLPAASFVVTAASSSSSASSSADATINLNPICMTNFIAYLLSSRRRKKEKNWDRGLVWEDAIFEHPSVSQQESHIRTHTQTTFEERKKIPAMPTPFYLPHNNTFQISQSKF